MTPEIRNAIREAYPTGKLAEPTEAVVARHRDVTAAAEILDALRQIPGVKCGEWAQVDELDRALRLAIHTSSLEFWSSGEAIEKRIEMIRKSGGLYCGLGVRISTLGPFWYYEWVCFSLSPTDDIVVSHPGAAPSPFWTDVETRLLEIFGTCPLRRLTGEELKEEVTWIEPDRDPFETYPERVTVHTCLFDFA